MSGEDGALSQSLAAQLSEAFARAGQDLTGSEGEGSDTGEGAATEDARPGEGGETGEGAGDLEEDADPVLTTVLAALGEHTSVHEGLSPREASELELVGQCDLGTIARYALVARVEDQLKITLPDAQVEAATTVGQMIELARKHAQ